MSRKIMWVALALIMLLWFTDGSLGGVTVESALIGWLFLVWLIAFAFTTKPGNAPLPRYVRNTMIGVLVIAGLLVGVGALAQHGESSVREREVPASQP